ncbi:MAG TPA: hypothetical protein VMB20_04875 [Candidatus Acidoferrum sp.]|nr:hypothetical protein [Candidatus Acidoferrum sp.]
MFTESRLLQVIAEIYEAAAAPAGLDNLAQMLARAFDSESALVVFNEMPNGGSTPPPTLAVPSTTKNFDAGARLSYAQYYHDINIWLREGLKNPLPAIVLCNELVDETTLMRHEWFDYCRETGMFHCLGTAFRIGDNVMGEIGIHRWRNQAPLVEDDKRKMAQLLPHLQRALQLQHRFGVLEYGRAVGLDVLAGIAIGVVLVDAKARILFSNDVAERVLRSKRSMVTVGRTLSTKDHNGRGNFHRLIRHAAQTSAGCGTSCGGVVALAETNGGTMLVSIAPLRARGLGFGPSMPAAIVTFHDPQYSVVNDRTLAGAYGFTPAEARLAAALARGATLAEYAQRESVAIGTARTHLKHIFQKTGWSRQTDLVRALADPILNGH